MFFENVINQENDYEVSIESVRLICVILKYQKNIENSNICMHFVRVTLN